TKQILRCSSDVLPHVLYVEVFFFGKIHTMPTSITFLWINNCGRLQLTCTRRGFCSSGQTVLYS
ncbi:hypothetical protein FRX31_028772, partial [Thalictrum thalictroides]